MKQERAQALTQRVALGEEFVGASWSRYLEETPKRPVQRWRLLVR